jgi:rod shape-determining protein MreD
VTGGRFALGAATVLTALLLQTTVVTRLSLPGDAPDLLLVLVVAFALVEGPLSGMVTGFVAGGLADLMSDHAVGRLALAYVIVGYLTGLASDDADRSVLLPFFAVAAGSAAAVLVFAGEGILLGDPRVTGSAVLRALTSTVPYDVVLTPFVVPAVGALVRRLDPDPVRR